MVGICPLDNPIREYAWGSHSAIADLLGQPVPAPTPQAELWMGAHSSASSRARRGEDWISLRELVREDPAGILGKGVAARFDGELPFLFKVLAVGQPLSIQAHPNREQARAGFARESAQGIALDARERNYRDPHAKPELICAVSPFSALCGFRPIADILDAFRSYRVEVFAAELAALESAPGAAALERLIAAVLSAEGDQRAAAIERAAKTAERLAQDPVARWITALASLYPGDVGVLAPLFLNLVELAPGEALYLAAGSLHSYLEGVGTEIMSNSDNVLRGGLTAKHVDVAELCRVLQFEPTAVEILQPRQASGVEQVFETPAEEFEFARLRIGEGEAWRSGRSRGVEILLSIEGALTVTDRGVGDSFALDRGASLLIPDSVACYELSGAGVVCRAGMPKC